jgi:1-acyl-sn-glycerol-3-phosphate acyltransferase
MAAAENPPRLTLVGEAVRRSASVSDRFLAALEALETELEGGLSRPAAATGPLAGLVLDSAREVWGIASAVAASWSPLADSGSSAFALPGRQPALDDFGVDAVAAEQLRDVLRPMARFWLGLRESGSKRPPERGGVLVLCNRSAWPLPVEALAIWSLLADRYAGDRPTYVLWDGMLGPLPWITDGARRVGLLEATPENCRQLLEHGAFVVAFPEGKAALGKTYDRRYRLARFDRWDLVASAVAAGAALVPAACLGPEESYPLLGELASMPITAQFPLAGAAGLLPLPLAWSLRVGGGIEYALSAEDPDRDLAPVVDALRERIQGLLVDLVSERRSLVFG